MRSDFQKCFGIPWKGIKGENLLSIGYFNIGVISDLHIMGFCGVDRGGIHSSDSYRNGVKK